MDKYTLWLIINTTPLERFKVERGRMNPWSKEQLWKYREVAIIHTHDESIFKIKGAVIAFMGFYAAVST